MIATVRIAPIEKWCEDAAIEFNAEIREVLLREGKVSILANSMHERGVGHGKFWAVEPEFQARIDKAVGRSSFGPAYVCEHMLEMD